MTTHELIKNFIVLVPDDELEHYQANFPDLEFKTIPASIVGLAAVRNWCLDNFPGDLLFLDDDITAFYSVCGIKAKKIKCVDAVEEILVNTYLNALEAGAKVFGLSQSADPRKYIPAQPFKLSGWLGTVIGVIDRDLRFDERNKIRVDVDYCLQTLMKHRMLWVENRFSFYSHKDNNAGGNALVRGEDRLKSEKKYLKNKWGKYIEFGEGKAKDVVKIHVDRKDNVII